MMGRRLLHAWWLAVALAFAVPTFAVAAALDAPAEAAAKAKKANTGKSAKKVRKPKGATARCEDGTYSTAHNRQGACAGHGGVAAWITEPKDTKAERRTEPRSTTPPPEPRSIPRATPRETRPPLGAPSTATAQCKDETYSYARHHRGACSSHGGVAVWFR